MDTLFELLQFELFVVFIHKFTFIEKVGLSIINTFCSSLYPNSLDRRERVRVGSVQSIRESVVFLELGNRIMGLDCLLGLLGLRFEYTQILFVKFFSPDLS